MSDTPTHQPTARADDPEAVLTHVYASHSSTWGSVGMGEEGAEHLADYLRFPEGRVWVRSMMNQSLDGSLTGSDATSASLANPTDHFILTTLRALPDIVIVGAQTARVEQYSRPAGRQSLRRTSRRPGGAEYPALAILTASGEIPTTISEQWPTFLITPRASRDTVVHTSGFAPEHVLEANTPEECIRALSARGYCGMQLEGGSRTLAHFLRDGVVDELMWTNSHITVGGEHSRVASGVEHEQQWSLRDLMVGPHASVGRYIRHPRHTAPEEDQ